MKKIIFVLGNLAGGGAERTAVNIATNLDRTKYEPVFLLIYNGIVEYDVKNIRIITLKSLKPRVWIGKATNFIRKSWNLKNIIDQEKPDLLMSALPPSNVFSIIASKISRKKPKIIITEQNLPGITTRELAFPLFWKLCLNYLYPKSDKIIAASNLVKTELIEKFKIKKDKILTIYNPLDNAAIKKLAEEPVNDVELTGKNKLVTMGRLVYQKGFDLLIKALAIVKVKEDFEMYILGKGEEEQNLKRLSKNLRLENKIHFLGFKKNPFKYISKCDVFIAPSRWEGFSCVIAEALSLGLPVITSTFNNGGIPEVIKENKYGLVVPVEDHFYLAKTIRTFLKDRTLIKKYSKFSKKKAQEFEVKKIVKRYETVFENVFSK